MFLGKFKKVLAQALIVMLMVPNLSVNAESNDANIKIQEAVKNEVNDSAEAEDKTETEAKANENTDNQKSVVVDTEVVEGSLVGKEYVSKKVDIPFEETDNQYLAERIEYKLKMEALSTMTVLETKTDAEYEVALAHEDGTFTYVSSVDSIEEAMEEVETLSEELEEDPEGTVDKLTNMSSRSSSVKLKSLSATNLSSSTLATVINNSGQVVYSTNAMARIIKYVDGEPDDTGLITTILYSDSSLTKAIGYINHMYVEDAPILEDAGATAKILVSGKEAWINKDASSSEYDMIVVPLNQVKNPSYYVVKDGELKHFISSDITDVEGSLGHTITIGKAPSYLSEGVRYFSYDGIYFYNGQDIENGLNILINDYKGGTTENAVNDEKPFYLYYNYLPFRSKTIYTTSELDKFITDNTEDTSKLRGLGSTLKECEEIYGVNAILTLGIAINESAWGMSDKAQNYNNLFGMNAIDSDPDRAHIYDSPEASVIEFTKNYISRGYADPADWRYNGGFLGNKNNGTNVRYASDPFWGEKASQYAFRIDKYLSGSVSALKDTDTYQLATATTNNKVMKSDGSLLYNITDDKNQYAAYVDTPFIITKTDKVNVSGQSTYEIFPERTTPVNDGGTANKFSGDYDWSIKGYVIDSGIKFLNQVKVPVTGVSLNKSSATLKVGESTTLVATVTPQNASNKNVTWKSSNTSVATVNSSGKVTAVSSGLATITVTTVDGSKTASCSVTVAPSVPTSVKAVSSSYNSIKVSWAAVSGASGYQVYRATSSTGTYTWLKTTTGTSYNNTGLTTNTTYYYKVRAYRTVGTSRIYSGFSSVVSAKPVPSVPTSVKAVSSSYNSIKVSWAAVSGASGYQVYRATSSTGTYSWLKTTTGTSYNNTGLTTNTTYYYKVRAYRTVGTSRVYSSFSSVVSAKPVPSVPTSVKAVSSSYNSIKTSWAAVSGASGYQVYRATSSTGTYSWLKTTTGTSYNNTGLTTNKTYYYKVRAYRTVGTSRVYSSFSSVVSAKPIPGTVTNLTATKASSTSIKLTWSQVTGSSGYQVYRAISKTGTYSHIKTTTSLSYTNTNLTTGTTYYYKVRAYRTVGTTKVYGNWSAIVAGAK